MALSVSEAAQGDLNGDGDTDDYRYVGFDARTGAAFDTGLAVAEGFHADVAAWSQQMLYFAVSEARSSATDLNGDGDAVDILLYRWP